MSIKLLVVITWIVKAFPDTQAQIFLLFVYGVLIILKIQCMHEATESLRY